VVDLDIDYLSKVIDNEDMLSKLLMFFPGYRGYKRRELLRETDRLVRETLYTEIRGFISNLREMLREIVEGEGRGDIVERLIMKAERIAERIRHAECGYAPLFATIRVNEESLRSLIRFDAKLADKVAKLTELSREARNRQSVHEKLALVVKMERLVEELDNVFSKRKERMLMLAEGEE